MEQTLVLIHNDAIQRGLVDEIKKRLTATGLKIIAEKEVVPTREMAEQHYRTTDEQYTSTGKKTIESMKIDGYTPEGVIKLWGTEDPKKIGEQIIAFTREFIIGKKLIAMVLEGEDAVARVRKTVGATDPSRAEKGTIRGDLSDDSFKKANPEKRKVRNLVHAADSVEKAKQEIELWFGKDMVR
ncbi:MAG: nucleoside-diphosphate kinase [Candidatus Micrarchaeota archaeon]|nr:nucleoside-diphosphate kinase [Candidatus Micrarchaeota archaeon]